MKKLTEEKHNCILRIFSIFFALIGTIVFFGTYPYLTPFWFIVALLHLVFVMPLVAVGATYLIENYYYGGIYKIKC